MQNYSKIDCGYYDAPSWLEDSRTIVQVSDSKELPFQIQSVISLSSGEIAVSGGPKNFEVLVFGHNLNSPLRGVGRKDNLVLLDSLNCGGSLVT